MLTVRGQQKFIFDTNGCSCGSVKVFEIEIYIYI